MVCGAWQRFVRTLTVACCSVRTSVANAKSSALRTAALRAIRHYCKDAAFVKSVAVTGIDYFVVRCVGALRPACDSHLLFSMRSSLEVDGAGNAELQAERIQGFKLVRCFVDVRYCRAFWLWLLTCAAQHARVAALHCAVAGRCSRGGRRRLRCSAASHHVCHRPSMIPFVCRPSSCSAKLRCAVQHCTPVVSRAYF